jgi:copper resistance protein C
MRRRLIRSLPVGAATAAVALAATGTAFGHAAVVSRSPAPGSTHSVVRSVRITFGEAVVAGRISLSTSSGRAVALRASGLVSHGEALRAVPSAALPSGRYVVSWRARADDGHSERGTWTFRVR